MLRYQLKNDGMPNIWLVFLSSLSADLREIDLATERSG